MTVDLPSARPPEGMRIYAIGDVHGYAELLEAMHSRIEADLQNRPPQDWRIIHVGDYVDRGPDSKSVIDFMIERLAADERIIALRGNHDEVMLDFLQGPDPESVFLANGGEQTAKNYGTTLDMSNLETFTNTARLFIEAVPMAHRRFLAQLPLSIIFGDFLFCHAGIDPRVPIDAQTPETLLWIRKPFLDWPHPLERVVVHGHTPQDAVDFRVNRINIDTGVYINARLSAVVLEGGERHVITVGD